MQNLESALSKVRGLVAKAEHPDTPAEEAASCRRLADQIMYKYAIDQAMLRDSMPEDQKIKPAKINITICEAGYRFEYYFLALLAAVAEHTRCHPVVIGGAMDAATREAWARYYGKTPVVTADVYGFEGDLRFFEILYTTLLLHMSNGIDPQIDPAESDDVNAYNLHSAGLNWLEIARLYYRRGHEMGWNGDRSDYMRYGSYWKRACRREARKRGEAPVSLPANFTEKARHEWRVNFSRSYVSTVATRLWQARQSRTEDGALILKSSTDAIREMLNADHPNLSDYGGKADDVGFNSQAWIAGSRHGQSADLAGSARMAKAEDPKALG